ncbi:hypothetical protein GME_04407 [Halomonas sp. TD01]|nr:hypothetical protein GME_04407 [Halomonas sp. TD01]
MLQPCYEGIGQEGVYGLRSLDSDAAIEGRYRIVLNRYF